jgi:hypothetical protein
MPTPALRFTPSPPPSPNRYGPQWSSPPQWSAPSPSFYPISVGRGLSLAFHMYRFGWRTFLAITLVVLVPIAVLESAVQYFTNGPLSDWQTEFMSHPISTPADASQALAAYPWQLLAATVVLSLLTGVISLVGSAALIDAAAGAVAGRRLRAIDSLRAALGRGRSLLALALILFAVGFVGGILGFTLPLIGVIPTALGLSGGPLVFGGLIVFVALLFAFVYVLVRVYLAAQALMIERLSAVAALRRSWTLLGGSMLRLVGWLLLFGLILWLVALVIVVGALIVGLIIWAPTLSSGNDSSAFALLLVAIYALFSILLAAIFTPLVTIGMTLLYFDMRWRHGEAVPAPGQGVSTPAG